jgi:D-alanyl-D-alanine carboxypeptidase (penicillin-binding protein 5/6)
MVAVVAALVGSLASSEVSAAPKVTAKAAVVMDAATGELLWSRRPDVALPPASTTKALTAIVALESDRLDERFRVSKAASSRPPSKIHLRPGQRMRLEDLVYSILLNSANDGAVVIAEGLSGSVEAFGRRMTRKARAIGAKRSTFRNPHGLTQEGHVATARDIATIFRYGLGVPKFRRVLQTKSTRVPVSGAGVRRVSLWTHNRLLTGYKYRVIGKTGYTRAAGRCFVGSANHDGREIVIAFLGSKNLWGDARALLGWAFTQPAEGPGTRMARRTSREATPVAIAVASPPVGVGAPSESVPLWVTADRIDGSGHRGTAGRYTLRFGPFDDERAAKRAQEALTEQGYVPLLAGRLLRLGEFSSPVRARHLAERLRRTGYRSDVVALY